MQNATSALRAKDFDKASEHLAKHDAVFNIPNQIRERIEALKEEEKEHGNNK